MNETFPEIMTISEISIYLRIARSSIYKLAQDGKIPCQKVGRHWRFRREAIDRWLEAAQRLDETPHAPAQNTIPNVD